MATPTTFRPFRRQHQKAAPSKGPDEGPRGTPKNGPEKTVNWPDPGMTGKAAKRLRGVKQVKTRMMERI